MAESLIGKRFGRLTILTEPFIKIYGGKNAKFLRCRCDCGNEKEIYYYSVLRSMTKSCGCFSIEIAIETNTIHNICNEPLYKIWQKIKERCYNKKCKDYKNYGGRGITMADYWLNNPKAFYDENINEWKPGLSIDRINNHGNYERDNIRWVSQKENCNNKRNNHLITAFRETKTISQWADDIKCMVTYKTLWRRIQNNWDTETAISKSARIITHV